MKVRTSKKRFSDKARERYVAAWKQSGKTRVAFAEEIGVSSKTLCRWIRERRAPLPLVAAQTSGFTSELNPALLPEKLSVDILLHNGIRVRILSHHNIQKLLSIIKEL